MTIEGKTHSYQGRAFCPRCGSPVFARYADEIEVHLGALDAPDQLAPTYEAWTVRRESWLLLAGLIVIAFNVVADALYAVLDPRIRHA